MLILSSIGFGCFLHEKSLLMVNLDYIHGYVSNFCIYFTFIMQFWFLFGYLATISCCNFVPVYPLHGFNSHVWFGRSLL